MPSTYAHFRFGRQVLDRLDAQTQQLIRQQADLYSIGLHGPDIYFYYHPLGSHPVNQAGYALHAKPAAAFFEGARKTILRSADTDAALAYILGFICHFALDSSCHPYVDEYISKSGLSHTEIEVEFDASLMREDGLDPLEHILTGHIHPSAASAEVISAFFAPISPEQTEKALRSMIWYNGLLTAPGAPKRFIVQSILRLSGNYKEMHGLLVNRAPNPLCIESTAALRELFDSAVDLAVRLIFEYTGTLRSGGALDKAYKHTFGAE